MRELDFLKTIKNTLSNTSHIGDDCANLKDLGIVVTQDSFVEDIHFKRDYFSAYEIGYKSIIVNISDILASGAKPKYITIALSLPSDISTDFIKDYYRACEDISKEFGIEVIGGDITGAEKICISVCAIGITANRNISSRSSAQVGDIIITSGEYGSSAAGLHLLLNKIEGFDDIKHCHKMPRLCPELSETLAKCTQTYAMMDTSDGFIDAAFKIAQSSNKTLFIDFEKIPINKKLKEISPDNWVNWALYGGEDYNLFACIKPSIIKELPQNTYTIIGKVQQKQTYPVIINKDCASIKINTLDETFNHFKD